MTIISRDASQASAVFGRPRGADGSGIIIIVGGDTDHYAQLFRSYTVADHIDAPYAIYMLRGIKVRMAQFWPSVKTIIEP